MDNIHIENTDFGKPLEDDINLSLTYNIFKRHIRDIIFNLLNTSNNNLYVGLNTSTLKKFIDDLYNVHSNIICSEDMLLKEMYIIHQICRVFYYFNFTELKLSHQEFRERIFYPNIIYCLIRYFPKANNFLKNTISNIFFEISRQSYGIIKKHSNAYNLDEDIIKTDVLYEFIGNSMKKFNPLKIRKLSIFYKQIFRNVFYYYFKKQQPEISYHSILNIELDFKSSSRLPTNLSMLRKALFELQIKKYCNTSQIFNQINYNYNIFRNVIIQNEFQDIYFGKLNKQLTSSNQLKLMKLYDNKSTINDNVLNEIMNLPIIYKLLKCVHIVNGKSKPYNDKIIKPIAVRSAVLDELVESYQNTFSNDHIYNILDKISRNFTSNILSGEYLNLVTLNNIKIDQISFITQLRKFVRICLNG